MDLVPSKEGGFRKLPLLVHNATIQNTPYILYIVQHAAFCSEDVSRVRSILRLSFAVDIDISGVMLLANGRGHP